MKIPFKSKYFVKEFYPELFEGIEPKKTMEIEDLKKEKFSWPIKKNVSTVLDIVKRNIKSRTFIRNRPFHLDPRHLAHNSIWTKESKKKHFRWPNQNSLVYKKLRTELKFETFEIFPLTVSQKKINASITYNKILKNEILKKKFAYKLIDIDDKTDYYNTEFQLNFKDFNRKRNFYKNYLENIKKDNFYIRGTRQLNIKKSFSNDMIPGLINKVNKNLVKNIKKTKTHPFKFYKYLYFKRKNNKSETTKQAINESFWNYSYNPVEKLSIKDILNDDTKNTHQQGIIKYNELVKPVLYDISPSFEIKKSWTTYYDYLPVLALKQPFRFESSKFSSYRILTKLIFNIKTKRFYDLFFATGTHKRVKISSKYLWDIEKKLDYSPIYYKSLNDYNSLSIYDSYRDNNNLILPFLTNYSTNFLLNNTYKDKDVYFFNPIINYIKERLNFFAFSKSTYYSIDRLGQSQLNNASMWLKDKHLNHSMFLTSFFNLKKLSFPFKFFRVLKKKFFKRKIGGITKFFNKSIKQNKFIVDNFKQFILKKTNVNFFNRVKQVIDLSLLKIKMLKLKTSEKPVSLKIKFNNFINNTFFRKFNIRNNLWFKFSNFKLKYRTKFKKFKTSLNFYNKLKSMDIEIERKKWKVKFHSLKKKIIKPKKFRLIKFKPLKKWVSYRRHIQRKYRLTKRNFKLWLKYFLRKRLIIKWLRIRKFKKLLKKSIVRKWRTCIRKLRKSIKAIIKRKWKNKQKKAYLNRKKLNWKKINKKKRNWKKINKSNENWKKINKNNENWKTKKYDKKYNKTTPYNVKYNESNSNEKFKIERIEKNRNNNNFEEDLFSEPYNPNHHYANYRREKQMVLLDKKSGRYPKNEYREQLSDYIDKVFVPKNQDVSSKKGNESNFKGPTRTIAQIRDWNKNEKI